MNPRQRKYQKQLASQIEPALPVTPITMQDFLKGIKKSSLKGKNKKEEYATSPPDANDDGSRTITFPESCSVCDKYTGATADNRIVTFKPGMPTGCNVLRWIIFTDLDGKEEIDWTANRHIDGQRDKGCYRNKENKRSLSEVMAHGGNIKIKFFDDHSLIITDEEGNEYPFMPKPGEKDAALNGYCKRELATNHLKFTPAYLVHGYLDDDNKEIIAELLRLGGKRDSGAKTPLTKSQWKDAIEAYANYLASGIRNTTKAEKIARDHGTTLDSLKARHSRANKKK